MEPTGQDKGQAANPNAPVFFATASPKRKKSEPEDKAGPTMKGKEEEGMNLKGKA